MPNPSSSSQQSSFRPPWRTPHTIHLKPSDQYKVSYDDSLNANSTSRHRPLGRTLWDGGRKSGTYGEPSEGGWLHPDDQEDNEDEGEMTLEDKKREWERTREDIYAKGGVDAILKSPESVLTVRDAKKAVPNFKLLDPRHHAFARFVLPVSEIAIKGQEWPGKKHEDDKKQQGDKDRDGDRGRKNKEGDSKYTSGDEKDKKATDSGYGSSNSQDSLDKQRKDDADQDKKDDEQRNSPEGDSNTKGDKQKEDPDVARLRTLIVEEVHASNILRNNDGRVRKPFQLLDNNADDQLESKISIDDQSTPDSWIPRSQQLLRLTGKHPLNAEPSLTALFDAGMITPTKLHYVRSHGPVPALDWDSHKLSVTVYIDSKCKVEEGDRDNVHFGVTDDGEPTATRVWTMDEIAEGQFPLCELPVTIACDGNRRKEVNMIKRSAGYNWSAAGVSTCVWRGIFIRDLLLATGLRTGPEHEKWFLNLEGADQCSEGTYATSIPLAHAMDPANDALLVFGQNDRVLHPDHGYPLRIVIPGFVGGRQVKWLKNVWISKEANSSHYHIWDNKVVPSVIDSKEHPLADAFFHSEDNACYEQILQSVICKPAHDERLPLPTEKGGLDQLYKVEGYAYDGSGTKVHRVELSLDEGTTWKYCSRHFMDRPTRHGTKHWAWVFWSCEVRISDLANCKEIAVRAFDTKKNTQPEHLTWNIMGIMNNSWYRVRPSLVTDPETKQPVIHFRHPVAPGQEEGGWMKPNIEDVIADQSGGSSGKTLSIEEVEKHNKRDDAWLILDGKVYDVTSVLDWHPGGANAIMGYVGKATVDATNQYKGIHDGYANSKRDECLIGELTKEAMKVIEKDAERAAKVLAEMKEKRKDFALQPDVFVAAKLLKREEKTSDTRLYTFELPKRKDGSHGRMGLPVGKHVQIAIHFADQAVMRSYTPVSPVLPHEEDGTFQLLVKTYFPSDGGPFPPGGTASNYLDLMQARR